MEHRRITKAGSVNIPARLRRELNLQAGDAMELEVNANGSIVLNAYQNRCIFCNNIEEVFGFKGKNVCKQCAETLKR